MEGALASFCGGTMEGVVGESPIRFCLMGIVGYYREILFSMLTLAHPSAQ
jgi:hypothetical protein